MKLQEQKINLKNLYQACLNLMQITGEEDVGILQLEHDKVIVHFPYIFRYADISGKEPILIGHIFIHVTLDKTGKPKINSNFRNVSNDKSSKFNMELPESITKEFANLYE